MDMTNPSTIREAFWASIDESVALAVAMRGATLVGSGTHFSCHRIRGSYPVPLVVKRAHSHFLGGLPEARAEWRRRIARVVNLGLSWVPPMITREKEGELFCIMPWCDAGPELAKAETNVWVAELRRHGLDLKDWPHVRWLGGVPVITDWSDLASFAVGTV